MRGMVAHGKLAFDHDGYPFRRPDLTTEAERLGSASQQGGQLRSLFGGQFRLPARGRMTAQSIDPLSLGAADPLAYRAWADSQGFCNLALCPTLLSQFPSTHSSAFAPVVWRFRIYLFHTIHDTT